MIAGTQYGAYRVLHQIGAGGMGEVWLAEHTVLGRRAALKVLHPMFSVRQDIVKRFFNEARAATAISDPGIVQIFDVGVHTDGSAYIVMEMLDGEPLDQRLKARGALAIPDALRILRQVASSLGAAHARGIVHRDLKPENIFLARDPEVASGERAKVLDFGIAKLAGDHVGVKTQTSAVMGTPTYMSPEQCRGAGSVDARSDIYSLGCVLFALITGRPPFEAEGAGDLIAMHLREPAPRLSTRIANAPPAVDELIARCLDKDPAQRLSNGAELAAALDIQLARASVASLPAPVGARARSAPDQPTTLSGSAASMSAGGSGRRRTVAIATAAACTIAIGGGAVWMTTRHGEESSPTDPPRPAAVPPTIPMSATQPPPPVVAPVTPPAPTPAPAPPPPVDPQAAARPVIETALTTFVKWGKTHAGWPCPNASELAEVAGDPHALDDPWGHPVAITCTDQPADQIIGVIAAGPDGRLGSDDDVSSWELGKHTKALIHGHKWKVTHPNAGVHPVAHETPPPPALPAAKPPAAPPHDTAASPAPIEPAKANPPAKVEANDDIPTERNASDAARQDCLKRRKEALKQAQAITDVNERGRALTKVPTCPR